MSIFRTVVKIPESNFKIDYNSKMLFIGSCFTENIGNILEEHLFQIQINPFGIVYNPISIKNSLDFIIANKQFSKQDLQFHNERWFTYHHHSRFSDANQELCLEKINNSIISANELFKNADFLFLTFGTTKVYRKIENQEIVANCHKLPSRNFTTEILSVEEIVKEFSELFQKLQNFNPNLKIIFTVSPIRHWADGAIQNQISKSTLLLAINELTSIFQNLYYFPVYEIFMDELRDYRFYADDMLHPNETAIKFVFEKFKETFFEKETEILFDKINSLNKKIAHRPFNENSLEYKKHLEKIQFEIDELAKMKIQFRKK